MYFDYRGFDTSFGFGLLRFLLQVEDFTHVDFLHLLEFSRSLQCLCAFDLRRGFLLPSRLFGCFALSLPAAVRADCILVGRYRRGRLQ